MLRRYHVNGLRIKVENIHCPTAWDVAIETHAPLRLYAPTPLVAAIVAVDRLVGRFAAVETEPWYPWETWHHKTQARSIDGIRMWIKYRPAPFDSYLVKTASQTIQVPTFSPYRTKPEASEVYDMVAQRAAQILTRITRST